MEEMPIVSIIIPTFNGSNYIVETIDCCVQQTYPNVEIIVVDDDSTDNTYELISNFARNKSNVKIIKNEKNMGLMANINHGVATCSGDYLIFLGHDDLLPRNHIEKIIAEFDDKTVFVHCNSITIDSGGNHVKLAKDDTAQLKKNENILYELSKSNFIHSCGTMVKKSAFLRIGGADEKYRNYGEWLYWIKMANIGRVKFSTATKSFRRKHESNLTKTFRDKKVRRDLFEYKCECRKMAFRYANTTFSQKLFFWSNYFVTYIKNTSKQLRT